MAHTAHMAQSTGGSEDAVTIILHNDTVEFNDEDLLLAKYALLAQSHVHHLLGHSCLSTEQYIINELIGNVSQPLHLRVELKYFSVTLNRSFLAEKFKYFEVMFNSDMQESQLSKIELHDIGLIDLLHIIDHISALSLNHCQFCYCHNNIMLLRLIDNAVYLQNDFVYKEAMRTLLDNLSLNNCFDAMINAFTYSNDKVFSKALRFCLFYPMLSDNSKKIKHYLRSHHRQIMCYYLQHPMLNKENAPSNFLLSLSNTENSGVDLLSSSSSSSSLSHSVPYKMIDVALNAVHSSGHTLQLLDCSSDSAVLFEHTLPLLRNHRGDKLIGYHVSRMRECIYFTGGEFGLGRGTWNHDIYKINTIHRDVKVIGKIPQLRRHHKTCCSSTSLYIAGGHDRYRCKRYEVFQLSLISGCQVVSLPSLCGVVDDILVDEHDTKLCAKCGDVYYMLHPNNMPTDWEVVSFDQRSSLGYVDGAIPLQSESVWYPDFSIPKFSSRP